MITQAKRRELGLRMALWLHHGCDHKDLYGDDAEMQCRSCALDFRRDPLDHIFEVVKRRIQLEKKGED